MTKNARTCAVGCDGINFTLVVGEGHGTNHFRPIPLKNKNGYEFGFVEGVNGEIRIYVSMPRYVRNNTVLPFRIDDISLLESFRVDTEQMITRILRKALGFNIDVMKAVVKTIECNQTMRVIGDCSCSQVLNMLNRCYHEGTNVVYQGASNQCKYIKKEETVIIRKRNYYMLKCYDKSLEQRTNAKAEIGDGLLRIEVVMQKRTIEKLFGKTPTMNDILTKQGIIWIIEEYKKIFISDVIEAHIIPCLNDITKILLDSLLQTNSPVKTLLLHKELVVDIEVLRKALKKWHLQKGSEDYSRQDLRRLLKYNFPRNVIDTLIEFKKACG